MPSEIMNEDIVSDPDGERLKGSWQDAQVDFV